MLKEIYEVTQSGRVVSCEKIAINKYENKLTCLHFNYDNQIADGRKYIAILNPKTKRYRILPLSLDDTVTLSTDISRYPGIWQLILLVTEDDYEITNDDIDQTKCTYVSNIAKFIVVRDNFLSDETIEEEDSPAIQQLIDETMAMRDTLESYALGANEDYNKASQLALQAQSSADEASSSEISARESAEIAVANAEASTLSAENAKASEDIAVECKNTVEALTEEVRTDTEFVRTSAQEIQTNTETAASSANLAEQYKNQAETASQEAVAANAEIQMSKDEIIENINTARELLSNYSTMGDGTKFLSDDGSYKEVGASNQVQADWNQNDSTQNDYIKNRPFYDETITFFEYPESYEGLDYIVLEENDPEFGEIRLYRLSDYMPSEELIGCSAEIISVNYDGENKTIEIEECIISDKIIQEINDDIYFLLDGTVICVSTDNIEFEGVIFPKSGFYSLDIEFLKTSPGVYLKSIKCNDIKKIDKKFIPDDIEIDYNDLKNKPCYDYIIPNQIIYQSESAKSSSQSALKLVDLQDGYLVEGEVYSLTVDGTVTSYICTFDETVRYLCLCNAYNTDACIFQNGTKLYAWTSKLWTSGQAVKLEGSIRRYKKIDKNLYDAVSSINGKTGDVTITPSSINAVGINRNLLEVFGNTLSIQLTDRELSYRIGDHVYFGSYLGKVGIMVDLNDNPYNYYLYQSNGSISNNKGDDGCVANLWYVNKEINALKTYVDNILSFNDAGELVVTLNGVTKTFVPKE